MRGPNFVEVRPMTTGLMCSEAVGVEACSGEAEAVAFQERVAGRLDETVFVTGAKADAEALGALGVLAEARPECGRWLAEDLAALSQREVVLVVIEEPDTSGWWERDHCLLSWYGASVQVWQVAQETDNPAWAELAQRLRTGGATPAQDDLRREASADVPPPTEDATPQASPAPVPEGQEPGPPGDPLTEGPRAFAPSPNEDREKTDESGSDAPKDSGPLRRSERPEAGVACGASSGVARNGQGKAQRKVVAWFDRMLTASGEG
jgi:hypothetical protein